MILDTGILIEILGNNVELQERLERIGEKAFTTTITKYELLKAPDEKGVRNMLSSLEIYDFDSDSAQRCARIYKSLKRKGKMINELDILIASIALTHEELLVTMDHDFEEIDEIRLMVL